MEQERLTTDKPDSELDPEQDGRKTEATPAAGSEAAERVNWTAILEERALVPDSELASPVAVPQVRPSQILPRPPRRRGLLHVAVAIAVLFTVAASGAVVMALWQDKNEPAPPAAPATPPPAAATPPPAPAVTPPVTPPAEPDKPDPAVAAAEKADAELAAAERAEAEKAEAESGAKPEKADKPEKAEKLDKVEKPDKPKRPDKPDREARPEPAEGETGEPADQPDEAGGIIATQPTQKEVAAAVEKIKAPIEACGKQNGVNGIGKIKMQVEPNGTIAWAAIREGGEAFQSCVSRLFKDVRLPKTQKGGTFVHQITIP